MSPAGAVRPAQRAQLFVGGFAIATVAAMCGIGGGLFAVPLLHYGFKLSLKAAVATSLCLVFATSISATMTEALHPGRALIPSVVAALVVGALLGAQIGHRVASKLPVHKLKALFAIVLLLAGARLLLSVDPGPPEGLAPTVFIPDTLALVWGAVIGLVAGVAVPLLGVGGGVIVVPSLLFVVPDLGYLGARACSLGMATCISARSIFLYRKALLIDWGRAPWFALGALLGAIGGVHWVHLADNAAVARGLLGAVLGVSAVRFGLDALRQIRSEPKDEAQS